MKKKWLAIAGSALLATTLVGCTQETEDVKKPETPNTEQGTPPEVADIRANELLQVLDSYVTNQLLGEEDAGELTEEQIAELYATTDLTDGKSEDAFYHMFYERTGIDPAMIKEGYLKMPLFNTKADEFIILKANDAKDVPALKEGLEKERAAQIQTWERYLPDQYELVKKNVIFAKGNYLFYVTFSDADGLLKELEAQLP